MLADHAVENRVGAGERAGVRCDRPCSGLGAADFGDDDRLADFQRMRRQFEQSAAVLDALDVAGADLDAGVGQHFAHHLDEIHVDLVTGVDEITEVQTATARHACGCRAERAGLGNECGRSRQRRPQRKLAECRHHVVEGIDQAETIRAQHAHAAFLNCGSEFTLAHNAFAADFRKTGAEHDRRCDGFFAELANRLRDEPGGYRDDGKVDRPRNTRHVRITFDAGNRLVLRIDRINRSRVLLVEQRLKRAPIDFIEIGRGAKNGDRLRRQQCPDGILHCCFGCARGVSEDSRCTMQRQRARA